MDYFDYGIRDSLVGIATGHGLNVPGVLIPGGARDFLFSETVQTGSGAHVTFYSEGTMCFREIIRTYRDRLRDPPSLLYNGYRVFLGGKGGRGVMLTTHTLLVPRLRKS
jgi:hypothetical protein